MSQMMGGNVILNELLDSVDFVAEHMLQTSG
jgi:hypothetical protein